MFMEDWQGCLSPVCQAALKSACSNVTRRGGYAVTLEDFLLSMRDEIPELCRFLRRQSVDLDELTRTIQCEQPIVTAVASENLLSSQLMYWLYCAREVSGAPWLDWPVLLEALAQSAERLRGKAYVAIFELVTCWPSPFAGESVGEGREESATSESKSQIVMADTGWLELAEDVGVLLCATPDALVWVGGSRGSGKTSWLQFLIPVLAGGAIEVDLRREADSHASDPVAVPVNPDPSAVPPVLVLDNVSPADLMVLLAPGFSVARELVTRFPGPVLLLGPDSPGARASIGPLQHRLGRKLYRFAIPDTGAGQKLAILTAHQPIIERRWRVELSPGALEYVAANTNPMVASPGAMLLWVERAAARLNLFAERGPLAAVALNGEADSVRRQSLLALARQQPAERFEQALQTLALERHSAENSWHERRRRGSMRLLTIDDLRSELERRVAEDDGSGQYTADQNEVTDQHPTGEQKLARPRNLYP
jgi:hypothetical protein